MSLLNPLHALHEQAEAAFLPYGPEIAIVESFGEVEAEYAAIRKGAALLDSPHRSVVILTGKDRLSFLHNKLTNDTNRLTPGQGCYAFLLNLKGRIVMDLNILQAEEATLIDLDARLLPAFIQTMEKYIFTEDVRILSGAEQLGRLTLLGPRAAELLRHVLDAGVETLGEPFRHARRFIGKMAVTVFRNDLAGAPQYELIVPRDQLVDAWQIFHEAGHADDNGDAAPPEDGAGAEAGERPQAPSLRAIGWSAFNTARIEAGTPLLGIDITDNYLPMETGHWYPRAVCVTKGCYIGQEIVARMHAHKTVARLLVGLRIDAPRLPVAGTEIFSDGQQVGIVTSSALSPMLGNVPIAMGYVKKAFSATDTEVKVLAEGARVHAKVTPLPFWVAKTETEN